MNSADEFHQVRAGLYVWQMFEPSVKCDVSSTALRLERGMVFVDPIPLAREALAELTGMVNPLGIVLTNGNHERAATAYREAFSVPLLAHAAAAAEFEIEVDRKLAEGEPVFDELRVIELPGAVAGEIALLGPNGVLVVGDALINLEPAGLSVLPDKYCTDPPMLRAALQKLLRCEFEVMTFAHGLPLVARARQRLETLLA